MPSNLRFLSDRRSSTQVTLGPKSPACRGAAFGCLHFSPRCPPGHRRELLLSQGLQGRSRPRRCRASYGGRQWKGDRPESFLWSTPHGMNSTLGNDLDRWSRTVFWWKTGISNLPFGGTSSTMAVQNVGNALVRKGGQPVPGGSSF